MQGDVFSEHSVGKTNIKQNQNFPESAPDPAWESLQHSPVPLAGGGLVAKKPAPPLLLALRALHSHSVGCLMHFCFWTLAGLCYRLSVCLFVTC